MKTNKILNSKQHLFDHSLCDQNNTRGAILARLAGLVCDSYVAFLFVTVMLDLIGTDVGATRAG